MPSCLLSAFVALDAWRGLPAALIGSSVLSLALAAWRLAKGQSLGYIAGGLVVTALSALTALLSGRAQDYFLAQIASTALTTLGCLGSVLVGRPLVAFSSHLARGWPLRWYWQPRVRRAYSEVTLAWGLLFGVKMLSQYLIYRQGRTAALGLFNVLTGWPATILVLASSYLYGVWRLQQLRGPSVQEFERGAAPAVAGATAGILAARLYARGNSQSKKATSTPHLYLGSFSSRGILPRYFFLPQHSDSATRLMKNRTKPRLGNRGYIIRRSRGFLTAVFGLNKQRIAENQHELQPSPTGPPHLTYPGPAPIISFVTNSANS